MIDIKKRKRNETRILADALRDPLSGVLNRRSFEKAAGEYVSQQERGAVVCLNLKQFKSINDRFDHQAGSYGHFDSIACI